MQLDTLKDTLEEVFAAQWGAARFQLADALGELTLEVPCADWLAACAALRDTSELAFEQCVDLCAVDYLAWGQPLRGAQPSPFAHRFAVVLHLMSIRHNWRLRVRTWVAGQEVDGQGQMPRQDAGDGLLVLPSLVNVWPSVNWFEREAFDMYGIVFEGHPDLRRILTDYGFIGHPFRKDFPLSGHVEMRYDPEQKRVIYQPVSIEPREVTPRIVREQGYGAGR